MSQKNICSALRNVTDEYILSVTSARSMGHYVGPHAASKGPKSRGYTMSDSTRLRAELRDLELLALALIGEHYDMVAEIYYKWPNGTKVQETMRAIISCSSYYRTHPDHFVEMV